MHKPPIHKSFLNAFRGLFAMLRSERNFQIELAAAAVNIFLIFFLKVRGTDAAVLLLTCATVLSSEIFNTAIEKICDIIQPEYDQRIKFIKDAAAGGVLLLSIAAVAVGLIIYSRYIIY